MDCWRACNIVIAVLADGKMGTEQSHSASHGLPAGRPSTISLSRLHMLSWHDKQHHAAWQPACQSFPSSHPHLDSRMPSERSASACTHTASQCCPRCPLPAWACCPPCAAPPACSCCMLPAAAKALPPCRPFWPS